MNNTRILTPEKILHVQAAVEQLIKLHQSGALGGKIMPEDANPKLDAGSDENYLYFTLPMALNYQRNAYQLWEAAKETYLDEETVDVFVPRAVLRMGLDRLRERLLKHKVALQSNRHPQIWFQLCETFQYSGGSVKNFFAAREYSVAAIKKFMTSYKGMFPYLSGAKLMDYWLYVMEQYTDIQFVDRSNITVFPDIYILQASVRLGLIGPEEMDSPDIRETIGELWNQALAGTGRCAVDIRTPLWLWSRNGFVVEAIGPVWEPPQEGEQLQFDFGIVP